MEKQTLLNTVVNDMTMEEVLAWAREVIPLQRSASVVELNVDVVIKIEKDAELRQINRDADLSLTDGMLLVWISRLVKQPVREKVSGSDLMPALCGLAAKEGLSIYILGGVGDVPRIAAENLREKFPGLKVAGWYSPPKGFEKDEAECARIDAMLDEARPDILFVCLGCPKQEKWLAAHRSRFRSGLCLCAGASVDFAAGNVRRAPKWMSEHGLEWFFRFLCEPKRLFKRYFIDDMQILRLIFKYR